MRLVLIIIGLFLTACGSDESASSSSGSETTKAVSFSENPGSWIIYASDTMEYSCSDGSEGEVDTGVGSEPIDYFNIVFYPSVGDILIVTETGYRYNGTYDDEGNFDTDYGDWYYGDYIDGWGTPSMTEKLEGTLTYNTIAAIGTLHAIFPEITCEFYLNFYGSKE